MSPADSADAAPSDPEDAPAEGGLEPWQVVPSEGEDPDGEAVVLRPLPGLGGGFNPIVGGGSLLGAFEEPEVEGLGVVERIPGEVLLEVSGPQGSGCVSGVLLCVSLALVLVPLSVLFASGGDPLEVVPRGLERQFWGSILGAILLGGVLGALTLNRLVYTGCRATFTSAGVAVEVGASASWSPWAEVEGYGVDEEVVTLVTRAGRWTLIATPAEAGLLRDLLDAREVPLIVLSTGSPQRAEDSSAGPQGGGGQSL